jgi:protocatechuate 3,4-dioxygenase beta subunit
MRVYLLIASFCFFSLESVFAQTAPNNLLTEVETKLKTGSAKVSAILTDNKYLALHPETSFRELIKTNCTPDPVKIATDSEPGKKIQVLASLKNEDGKSIAGAVVYFYQTDAKGWYAADQPHVGGNSGDQRHARLFGYTKTDATGNFEIQTVKPSGYPQSDLPAHIHVEVHDLPGYQTMITEFLFDDDERLVGNIRTSAKRNRFLIAKPGKTKAPFEQQLSYTIHLQKN